VPIRGKILYEAVKLNPTAVIDLFQLDLRPVGALADPVTGWNGVLYFHSGNQINKTDVSFAGVEYAQWPVDTKNFEWTTTSTQPRPTVSFSNVLGPFTQLNLQYGGLVNAKLTRIRTFAKFLDGMPEGDPSCFFPPETWLINRKTQEDREICTYELSNPMDIEDLSLPKRIVMADQCRWIYRGDGCAYTGTDLADINNEPLPFKGYWNFRGQWNAATSYSLADVVTTVNEPGGWANQGFAQWFVCLYPNTGQTPPPSGNSPYWARDECSLNVDGCKIRFLPKYSQYGGMLPFGGFPGVELQPIQVGQGAG